MADASTKNCIFCKADLATREQWTKGACMRCGKELFQRGMVVISWERFKDLRNIVKWFGASFGAMYHEIVAHKMEDDEK